MTRPLGFTGNLLFRDSEKRGPDSLPGALADPRLRVCLLAERSFLTTGPDDAPDAFFDRAGAQALGADMAEAVLLGHHRDDGAPVVVATAPMPPEGTSGVRAMDLRGLAMSGVLKSCLLYTSPSPRDS